MYIQMHENKFSLEFYFKFIYKLATIFGQTPTWNFELNIPSASNSVLYKNRLVLVIIVQLFNLASTILVIKLIIRDFAVESIYLTIIIAKESIIIIQLFAICIISQSKKWTILMTFITKNINQLLYDKNIKLHKVIIHFITGNFLFLIPFVAQQYVTYKYCTFDENLTSDLIWTIWIYFKFLTEYANFINFCIVYNLLWILNSNYIQILQILKNNFMKNNIYTSNSNGLMNFFNKYTENNEYATIVNDLFGNIILIKLFSNGLILLDGFFHLLTLSDIQITSTFFKDYFYYFRDGFFAINNFMQTIVLMYSYHIVQNNANYIPNYFYKIVDELQMSENEKNILLIRIINCSGPTFTANRFFLLNKGTIFALVANTLTYLIVVIQMR